jgi:hypothetical protein
MRNAVTKSFFTRRINGGVILWKKWSRIGLLNRYKKLLETLIILCHLLGGQRGRSTELATLRWRNTVDEQSGMYCANGTIMLLAM